MSDLDAAAFSQKVKSFSDDELIAAASINADRYNGEAVALIRAEVESRGLSDDIQNKIFDVFLNTSGFAGRLILLEEQLMFLSTGLRAAGPTGGSGIGVLMAGEARLAERNVAAERLDFSALDNEGSWIYYLDEIKSCEPRSGILSGKELVFEVEEENGNKFTGSVKCSNLTQPEFQAVAEQIEKARAAFLAGKAV